MTYTFDFVDQAGRIDHFDMALCCDDEDAQLAARRALGRSSTAVRVMIWDEGRRVGEIARSAAMPAAAVLEFRA